MERRRGGHVKHVEELWALGDQVRNHSPNHSVTHQPRQQAFRHLRKSSR